MGVMLAVNRAKYAQHAELRTQLLATGRAEIVGGPNSTGGWRFLGENHRWDTWNGRVQMMVREELRLGSIAAATEGVGALYAALTAHFEGYPQGRPGPPLQLHTADIDDIGAGGGGGDGNLGGELASLAAFGLVFPWACGVCTFENASFPQMCEACEAHNPTHAAAPASRRAAVGGANKAATAATTSANDEDKVTAKDGADAGGGMQVTRRSSHLSDA